MTRPAHEAAVDAPLPVIVACVAVSALACVPLAVGVVGALLRRYERLVGPLRPSEAYAPPRATEARPVPHSAPRGGIPS